MSVLKEVVSRVRDRTLEMWVPRERWMPLHSIQSTIPRLIDTHSVFDSDPQSAHHRLPWSWSRTIWRSLDGLSSKLLLSVRIYIGLEPTVRCLLKLLTAFATDGEW